MLSDESLDEAAECLKVLAHPMRLKLIMLLLKDSMCVGALAEKCGIASHVASEHLRLMERCGFLESTRNGRYVHYSVAEPHLEDLVGCMVNRFN